MNLFLFDVSNFGRRLLGSTTLLFSPGNHLWRNMFFITLLHSIEDFPCL